MQLGTCMLIDRNIRSDNADCRTMAKMLDAIFTAKQKNEEKKEEAYGYGSRKRNFDDFWEEVDKELLQIIIEPHKKP